MKTNLEPGGGQITGESELETGGMRLEKEIPIAEDIARFRAELEEKIFGEGLPAEEWAVAYEEIFQKYKLKDEILARLTLLIFYGLSKEELADQQINNILDDLEDIEKALINPEDFYYRQFLGENSSGSQEAEYRRKIKISLMAASDIFFLYQRTGDMEPARMTINVLEKFPLQSWPAIVRLIKSKH
ncbi:hypothetical protein A3G06_00230 [Candidatus Nomurabacteria bacterium RIFCSPLOWO2_12_FULL_46_14]|uniref:Uncharacterized protein n=1 Tax=Candidatus Nomurabacteria bacterium RIFCSPLOWO2_12_FULL_46_14 TaxID=1801797 RepID=A0A1F6Y8R4_9BACT|nr:MAG: hypothetical protein A2739_02315 [Candidatus Giovannonibacteria bacterium RIFCSPHIGHO2_01_FULL_43_100]OGJ02804.1 MAG: hypothetical protein A3G06_00230 [Candidatus Nomurabacteria bacterium RIFCSPLOWO2_12_FULL_46_14]